MAEKIPQTLAPAPSSAQTVAAMVVGHYDVHGVCAAYLAAKAFNATEAYASYPQTGSEQLVTTLQNLFAAAPARLTIYVVDVPVDLKNPSAFIRGLEDLASIHNVMLIDHHESSLRFFAQFSRVKAVYVGPSALTLNEFLLSQIPNAAEVDRIIALIGAVGDRDPEVVRRGLFNPDLQALSDGLDVFVRQNALTTLRSLVADPVGVLERARSEAGKIPSAVLSQRVGPVAVSLDRLPSQWGPKALEKMAFASGTWYATGWGIDERTRQPIVRAIIRWDVAARMPHLPMPATVARQLWSTRNIIGHPAAPSIAAVSETEAQEMASAWARAIAEAATKSAAPQVVSLISETKVGEALAEVLHRLEQLLELQTKMYSEYLELKRRQVQLLERVEGQGRARAAD